MFLLDTNVLILAIKAEEPERSFLEKIINKKQLYLSTISIAEFLTRSSSEEKERLEELIVNFPVLNVDLETAKLAAEYRKESLKLKRIQMLDCFLAAQAKLNGLTLVTNNKSDFPMKDIKTIIPFSR